MALRLVLYVVMALGFAGFAGVSWMVTHPPAPASTEAAAPAPPPVIEHKRVTILAAARPLRAGTLLGPEDIAAKEVEADAPDIDTAAPVQRDALLGGMVRQNLEAGAQLRDESVLRPKDRGFLAAVLEPGMRAVSVAVDAVSGAAGLIWPGDRVDLVLTQSVDASTQPAARRVSGETMLTGLRVIAVDQQLMQGSVSVEGVERQVRTVTLEVTSPQAERIAVGARLGRLSLAVHASRADDTPDPLPNPPRVTWGGDVSSAFVPDRPTEPLRVYSGPDKTQEMHF